MAADPRPSVGSISQDRGDVELWRVVTLPPTEAGKRGHPNFQLALGYVPPRSQLDWDGGLHEVRRGQG